jgi:hypothetical protein
MSDRNQSKRTADPNERRGEPRQPVSKSAEIHTIGKVARCIVRDISPSGAGVEVKGLFIAPEYFDLLILESGLRRSVEKRWQNGSRLGVRFLAQEET